MKKLLITVGVICFMSALSAGQGWCDGETEVKIIFSDPAEKEVLHAYYQGFWLQKDACHSYQEIIDLME